MAAIDEYMLEAEFLKQKPRRKTALLVTAFVILCLISAFIVYILLIWYSSM